MVEMRRGYENPPVIESLCEFQFRSPHAWDLTVPGLVYERVSADFPIREIARTFETSLAPGPESVQQRVRRIDRAQFWAVDRASVVQVSENLLAVNHLRPYTLWENRLPTIRRVLEAYRAAALPTAIGRISLRYINDLAVPGRRITLEDYFHFYPHLGPNLPQVHSGFLAAVQVLDNQSSSVLQIVLSNRTTEEPKGKQSIMLDLSITSVSEISFERVEDFLDQAHTRINDTFEGCITDKARALFVGKP